MSNLRGTVDSGYEFTYSGILGSFNLVKETKHDEVYRVVLDGGSVSFMTKGNRINREIGERGIRPLYGRVEGPIGLAEMILPGPLFSFLRDKKVIIQDNFSKYFPNLGGQNGA